MNNINNNDQFTPLKYYRILHINTKIYNIIELVACPLLVYFFYFPSRNI